mmetsp:Transcript_13903/g.32313  ORF Transcript_13903/g.32313 Transcript_13903/m.32313 type:complete len:182 (+) Transcript_13903:98-643(+)
MSLYASREGALYQSYDNYAGTQGFYEPQDGQQEGQEGQEGAPQGQEYGFRQAADGSFVVQQQDFQQYQQQQQFSQFQQQQQQQPGPPPPPPAAPLPAGWSENRDGTGRSYFVNQYTNTTQWERPFQPAAPPPVVVVQAPPPAPPPAYPALPPGWEEKRDPTGKVYYTNHADQTTSWERPLR